MLQSMGRGCPARARSVPRVTRRGVTHRAPPPRHLPAPTTASLFGTEFVMALARGDDANAAFENAKARVLAETETGGALSSACLCGARPGAICALSVGCYAPLFPLPVGSVRSDPSLALSDHVGGSARQRPQRPRPKVCLRRSGHGRGSHVHRRGGCWLGASLRHDGPAPSSMPLARSASAGSESKRAAPLAALERPLGDRGALHAARHKRLGNHVAGVIYVQRLQTSRTGATRFLAAMRVSIYHKL